MNFIEIVKKKGTLLMIIHVIILFGMLALFTFADTYGHMSDAIAEDTEVRTLAQLKDCYEHNRYVKLYFDEVYSTQYAHSVDDQVVAYYVDFVVDGYSIVGLVKKAEAETIFAGEQNYVCGKLTQFAGDNKESFDGVVNDYAAQADNENDAILARDTYLPFQLSNSIDPRFQDYIAILFFGAIMLVNIIFIVKGAMLFVMPGRYLSRKECDPIADGDYEGVACGYNNKGIIITDKYFIRSTLTSLRVFCLQDISWGYHRVVKSYGIITIYQGMVFKTASKQKIECRFQDPNIYAILLEKNPGFLVGFTQENIRKYKEQTKK